MSANMNADTSSNMNADLGAKTNATLPPPTLRGLTLYFLRLGTLGFGGPIALAGAMQRDLVEHKQWLTAEEYKQGLALAQLAPGPLAAQLAMYIGWVRGGLLGSTIVGITFVLPSFLMVLALSVLYLRFGGLSWIQGAFYGIGAAVIAVIARSVFKLVKMTIASDRLLWFIFLTSGAITAATESEIVWVFIAGGVLALIVRGGFSRFSGTSAASVVIPDWLLTGLHGAATPETLWAIGTYFAEAGAFVFGSGLAIVPFLHAGVVDRFHWLDERQFLDAVAVAMITPGPVVITVAFIGYLVGGATGATVAALGTFLPCYLFTVIPAPHFHRIAKNARVKAFVDGVSAAATGAIGGAAIVLGRRAITDAGAIAIALATLLVLFRFKKTPEPLLILAAGVCGLLLRSASSTAG